MLEVSGSLVLKFVCFPRIGPSLRWLTGAGLALALLAGHAATATPTQVILVRHAEKDRERADNNLTPKGLERAIRLGQMIPACFGTPTKIRVFQLDPITNKHGRSYQTAVPLAVNTGVNIGIFMGSKEKSRDIGELVRSSPEFDREKVVIFWQRHPLPELANGLGFSTMAPIDSEDYDPIFVLTYSGESKEPKVQRLSQNQLFRSPCNQAGIKVRGRAVTSPLR